MLLAIVLLLVFAVCNADDKPTVTNCGDGKMTITFNPDEMGTRPYPVQLPGTFSLDYGVDLSEDVDLKSAQVEFVKLSKVIFGGTSLDVCKIPLVGKLCDRKPLCTFAPAVCKELTGNKGHQKGSFDIKVKFPSELGFLAEGKYDIIVKATSSDGKEIGCVELNVETVKAP